MLCRDKDQMVPTGTYNEASAYRDLFVG
ncbi:hypothetical protein NITLEN_90048 [Nitrospira lenta]|uniref:Uncharacterized protein n=1 Tax=Nitrospira lenta TaxID=1436998 RepID=A0A330LCK5_9BACT|nr:hypothetical protein NITLEN_90048 [Nitrospira lenta]